MHIREKVKHILKKYPERIADFVEDLYGLYPVEVGEMVDELYYGCHIRDKKLYDKAVEYFENPDGTKGAHWSIEDIEKSTSIDFEKKDYTLLDFCYAANMKYSDIGDIVTTENILKVAKRYLEDADFPGDPSERAYKSARKRIKYFEERDKEG